MNSVTWETVAVLLTIVVAFGAFIILAVKTLIEGVNKNVSSSMETLTRNFDEKLDAINNAIDSNNQEQRKLERDFLEFKADLPRTYAMRDDMIRNSAIVEAKQDTLGERVNSVNNTVQRILAKMEKSEDQNQ